MSFLKIVFMTSCHTLVADVTMVNTLMLVVCQGKPVRKFFQQDISWVARLVCFNCI